MLLPDWEGLDSVSNKVTNYKMQKGTKLHPARSCRDIHLSYPNLKSGQYWVDPNEGCKDDALHVYCDFSKNATCVYPKNKKINMTELDTIDEFEYTGSNSQLKFLRLLSERAYQTITYHCKNSKAWEASTSKSIKLKSYTDEYLSAEKEKLMPTVVSNGCMNTDTASWDKTVLAIDTKKRDMLPIIHVVPYDKGESKEFKIEVGRVCFA